MPHFVYILQSLKDFKYYTGETANVESRINFHNCDKQRSTRYKTPFRLVLDGRRFQRLTIEVAEICTEIKRRRSVDHPLFTSSVVIKKAKAFTLACD